MNQHTAWYLARATGYVAWMLLTCSVVVGLLLSTRLARSKVKPAWLLDFHRFLAGATVIFTALHVGGLMADDYVEFDLVDVLVPFASQWRPLAVAMGVTAMYLLISIEVSSLIMKRIPRKLWRSIHLGSYVLFWIATFHLLAAGTDTAHPASRIVVALAVSTVVFLSLTRVLSEGRGRAAQRVRQRSGG